MTEVTRGYEADRLDRVFAVDVPDDASRAAIFESAARILAHGPGEGDDVRRTGLALGYVQSGKTMSFTALTALAADNGYRLVIAFLGSINMLLDQNTARLVDDLGVEHREDYTWVHLHRPNAASLPPGRLDDYLLRGKPVLVTVLKHAGRIHDVAEILRASRFVGTVRALVIDDEADQISLNTAVKTDDSSRTYAEIVELRRTLGPHLYVQYTATPFAPLLIEARDVLSPDFVEVLQPGPGYTGGETFFVAERDMIVRRISDAEADDKHPTSVPTGLRTALGTFFAGAALLQCTDHRGPVSMLVHPSHLNVVQAGYRDLVVALVDAWKQRLGRSPGDPGREHDLDELIGYAADLERWGVSLPPRDEMARLLADVLVDTEVWLVNSMVELHRIDWRRSPVHVLIGGNKLDRGFTVKGLTVTYMTRAAAKSQADTVEQRARAFGYKRNYLEFCRFFAPDDVVETFTGLVHTEDDMRASLLEWAAEGRPLADWAEEVGLVLPAGLKPTRATVLATYPSLFRGAGWHTMRRPDLDDETRAHNDALVQQLDLVSAPETSFGAVAHRHLRDVDVEKFVIPLLEEWRVTASPGWQHDRIFDYVGRAWRAGKLLTMDVLLLEERSGGPRRRGWTEPLGIPNLMQGSDTGTGYPGDRNLLPDRPYLQVHRVRIPSEDVDDMYTLALYLPVEYPEVVVRRQATVPVDNVTAK